MKHPGGLHSLRGKLNLLIIGIILVISAGLMSIAYYVFCQRVDDSYNERLQRAAEACSNNVDPYNVENIWNAITSEPFQEAYDRAKASGDESILRTWMDTQPSYFYLNNEDDEKETQAELTDEQAEEPENQEQTADDENMLTLYDDYEMIIDSLQAIKDYLGIDSAYLQIDIDGATYNIADPEENLFYLGTQEIPLEVFDAYEDNSRIPPTVYKSEFGWLCTAIEPICNFETGEAFAIAGVDINMTDIVKERYAFLTNSLIFVLLQTIIAIAVSMLLMDRIAVRPLRQLAEAATGFAAEDHVFTEDDVIQLNIRSRDEIGDLYREIQSMQSRIVSYTENLTRVTAEKERVSTELRTASQIQEAMLPHIFPPFPNRTEFDLYASMDPAKEVGGDFYDFFLIDEDHLALVIADVSDKGVPAALFMMSAKILINYRAQQGGSPAEILNAVNAEICKNNKSRMFVTVWLGILTLSTGALICTNAGHENPIIRGQDGVYRVLKDKHGMVLGALQRAKYTDYELQLQPGDAVFVYTDGVPEANNTAGEFYSMERLEKTLNTLGGCNPQGVLKGIRADVDAFAGDAQQFDDLTMLCLEYRGSKTVETTEEL